MSEHAFVSVIVPVRGAEGTIAECIKSLLALNYPADRYEVILVDNGATDRMSRILAGQGVRVLRESRKGSYVARNTGAWAARGDIFAFTDADCVADPAWLDRLIVEFADPAVGCVAGEVASPRSVKPLEEFARRLNLLSQDTSLRHPFRPYAITANCAYRADVFRQLGGFRAEMQSGGDADLAWRMQLGLGLRIARSADAVVWHSHRASLRDLLAQSQKYAMSTVDLARLYNLPRPPLIRRIAGLALAALRAVVVVPVAWAGTRGRWGDADLVAPICEVTWRAGEVAGLLRSNRDPLANRR
ncbi:MAG: glycosyltransferase [bacterium]